MVEVKFKTNNNVYLPYIEKYSSGASGFDLFASIENEICLMPTKRKLIPTGIYLEIPRGYEGQIRPRSGLAYQKGITVFNSPGTIDSDYRGEIKVLLINLSRDKHYILRGDRIAQLVINKLPEISLIKVNELSDTKRGVNGFGSTGN